MAVGFGYNTISPILMESVSNVTATAVVNLGTRVTVGGIDYIYVYNATTNGAISQGQGGFISPANFSSMCTVTVSNAASQAGHNRLVGVAHNATIPTGYYGWLATRGPVYIALDASEVSMGSAETIVPGVDGGFVKFAQSVDTAVTGQFVGIGLTLNSCVTTVGTGKAWIKSPLF